MVEEKTRKRKFKNLFNFFNFVILLYWIVLSCGPGFTEEDFVYDAADRRDPLVPLISADGRLLNVDKETQQEIVVNGIIYDKQGSSYAIVNSTVVKVADTIGEYKVLRIEQDKVVFDKNGQPLEVGIYKEETE